MSIFDLFWILFAISAIQPLISQQLLLAQRRRLIRHIEESRKCRVIGLIHRQETMSFLGFPIVRFIDIDDSEQVLRAIKLTAPEAPIDLILHTPGGLVLAAEQIAHALQRHRAKVTVFVPHYAMSGGTLVALSADEIVMDENAVLGPVDPQLGQSPAVSILKVVERKPIAEINDQTLIQADMAEKALRQVESAVHQLLSVRMEEPKASEVAHKLSSGTWTHDYGISVYEARELGVPVSTDMPALVYELMQRYPQSGQRRPSVEYIPLPYGTPERRPNRAPESVRKGMNNG